MGKTWKELRLEIHPSLVEAASNFLIEQGSPGITQEEVKGAHGPKRERLLAYFPNNRTFNAAKKTITTYLQSICKSHHTHYALSDRTIQEEKWAETWKENFKPLEVTPRMVVKPPWETWLKKEGQIAIEIDPGMAFGTGAHPSTQMCLRALEELILSAPHQPSMLDVGTGSGILAIAARKLGAKQVLAIDLDPVAIDCARKNAQRNHIDGGIDFRVGSLDGLRRVFDIVAANLLPQELLLLAPYLSKRISSRGSLIVSGLLRSQKKEMAAAFSRQGLEILCSRGSKGWASFVFGRKKKRGRRREASEAAALQN
jgi:ribosomal protein L11 methyltransferase